MNSAPIHDWLRQRPITDKLEIYGPFRVEEIVILCVVTGILNDSDLAVFVDIAELI